MFVTATTPRLQDQGASTKKARNTLAAAGRIAVAIFAAPMRLYEDRQLRQTMAGLSDHELADIGLTRQDIADTTALPLGLGTGEFVGWRAGERRRQR